MTDTKFSLEGEGDDHQDTDSENDQQELDLEQANIQQAVDADVQHEEASNNTDVHQDVDSSETNTQEDVPTKLVSFPHDITDCVDSNCSSVQEDTSSIMTSVQQDEDSDKLETGQTASESDSGSGENQSHDSDSPIFPLASNQGSSFNYLQDLKKRKMKMKVQSANIMKTTKLLKMIRLQSKFPVTKSTHIDTKFPESPSGNGQGSDSRLPNEDAQASDSGLAQDLLGSSTASGEGNTTSSLPFDSGDLYHCHLCPVAFASPISLRGHMSTHKIQKKFLCPICSKSFAHSSTLNYHIRKHKGDLRYKCDICGKRFLKPFRLKAHISCVHSGEKPFVCSYCNKAFSCSINLTRHTRIHTGERPFLCLLCGKRYRDNSSFALHRRYHSQNRPYSCEVCGKAFVKMHFLKTHMKCVHADDKTHECFICNKTFKVRDYLRKHLLTHQENKRYKCDFCEKTFPRIGSLKKHRYLHTGEEPFKCDVCLKGFRDAYTLAKHKRLHERKIENRSAPTEDEVNEKKKTFFECDKCGRKYSLSGSLKIHKQKFCKGTKPSKERDNLFCSGCGMLFHHKQSLAKHMKMTCEAVYGKKEKVFLCSTCGLVFFSRVMLNDHLRTTTCSGKETPENYKCGICGAEFSHRATLSKHKKLHVDVNADADEEAKTEPGAEAAERTKQKPIVDELGRRMFECKFCAQRFRSKSALYDTHMRKCHGRPASEKKNACEQCGRKFHSKSDLRAHVRIHTGEKPFTCGVCGKSFTQRGHVSMHMKIHTGQRDFPCTICGKAFQFATTLRNHVKIHTGERPHVCDICGKGFIKYNNLKNHLAQHEKKNKMIKQELQELDLSQVMTLNQDNSGVTVSPVKKNASGKLMAQARKSTSTSTSGTRRSSRSSRGSSMKKLIEQEMNPVEQFDEVKVEPVEFDEADAVESRLSSEETEDKPEEMDETEPVKTEEEIAIDLKCPFCEDILPNAYELATHIKSHTGNRPFMCKDCGKSFVLASHLRCHMQVHGKKQQEYRCLVCTENFDSSRTLQEHMRSHKGERPYGCYFCDKAYGTSQHLRRHVRSAHPDKIDIDMNMLHMPANTLNDGNAEEEEVDELGRRVFRCKFCDKVYQKNQHLLRHIRTSHPDWLQKGRDYQPGDPVEEAPEEVRIKTEIVWDPETTSAEDTDAWNAEDKYITPDSLKSDDSSTDESGEKVVQSPCAEAVEASSLSKSEERIYIPPQLRGDLDRPVTFTAENEPEVSDRCVSSEQGAETCFLVEIKQEPSDREYEAFA